MLERALARIAILFDANIAAYYRPILVWLSRSTNFNRVLQYIARAADRQQAADHLATAEYALVFADCEFSTEVEPCGRRGPDLAISKQGQRAYVEVTRFRRINCSLFDKESREPQNEGVFEYGNIARDSRKSYQKILSKFRQTADGDSIIAIWNDDEDLEECEVQCAVDALRRDAETNANPAPTGLAFVIYGSKWISSNLNLQEKQYYCFPMKSDLSPHCEQWMRDLDRVTLPDVRRRILAASRIR